MRPLEMPFLLIALAFAAWAPGAHAAWFPAAALDGPSATIRALGDIDLARDGTGGVVYVKDEAGVPHVFISRHYLGTWHPPERVDVGLETAASQPAVAAGDGHRLAIAWVSGGRLYGVVAAGGSPAPLPAPQQLYADADPVKAVSEPHADMGINGTAYAVFTAPGGGGSDVRAVRLQDASWEQVAAPLDIVPERAAGDGTGRPRVAVSAEGNAVAVWGEDGDGGRRRVFGRRVTGLVLSVAPQEISLAEFEGAAGGAADAPDVDIEDDGSYAWAVWRQDFGSGSRAIARRLVGSQFETPVPVDGGNTAAETPRISMSGRGVGGATAGTGAGLNGVQAAVLELDVFGRSFRLDGGGSSSAALPVVATSEKEHLAVAWRTVPPGGDSVVRARHRPKASPFDAEMVISAPEFGPAAADGLEIADDRAGNFAVAFLQGGVTGRRLVVAVFDRPPGPPVALSTTNYQRRARPNLKWKAGADLWGIQRFRVLVDGQAVGESDRTNLTPAAALADGPHEWRVVAIDRRGQETTGRRRTLRIDSTPPEVLIRVVGKRKRGETLKIGVSADDDLGSGLRYVEVDYGDGSRRTRLRRSVHRYRKSGKRTLTVKAVDKAGNVTRQRVVLRIRK